MQIDSRTSLPTPLAGNDASSTARSDFEVLAAMEKINEQTLTRLDVDQNGDQLMSEVEIYSPKISAGEEERGKQVKGEEEQGKQLKSETDSTDSWLDRAWGSVRDTAESVGKRIDDTLLPIARGEWDRAIGTAVRSIASGGFDTTTSPKQRALDKEIGAVVRKAARPAADAVGGVISIPHNRRA